MGEVLENMMSEENFKVDISRGGNTVEEQLKSSIKTMEELFEKMYQRLRVSNSNGIEVAMLDDREAKLKERELMVNTMFNSAKYIKEKK